MVVGTSGNNEKIIKGLKERLEKGNILFKQEMPLDGEAHRDNSKELYEEVQDALLYCAARIASNINTTQRYKQAYQILMSAFDEISDDTRKKISKQLEELNL